MRRMQSLAMFMMMLLVVSAPLMAQGFGGDVRINDDAAGTQQGAPQIQIGPDGRVYLMWIDFRNGKGEIAMATSSDGGLTFSPNRMILRDRLALAGMQRGAQFVVDRDGGIHLVFQERNPLGNVSAMYSRSTDGGVTFSTPTYAGADEGAFNQDFPSIAVDSSNNIYLAWVDDRDKEEGRTTYTQLYFTRSTDRGATFSTPVTASVMPGGVGGSCECCNTAIATTPDGTVYIAFRGNIANARDVHIARTRDGGATFDVFAAASQSWMINACPMTGSSIAVDRTGRAHAVWRDSRQAAGGKEIVYYASLGADDSAATLDKRISDSPKRTNFPSIGITREGAIVVAWQDTRIDGNDVQVTTSLDGGNTFSQSSKLTTETAPGRQELVVLAVGPDGTRYAVWQDLRRDAGDVYFSRDTSTLTLMAPQPPTLISPANGVTLASVPMLTWSAPSNLGDALQVWYGVELTGERGSPILAEGVRAASFPVDLAAGQYSWAVTANTLVGAQRSETFAFTVGGTSSVESDRSLDAIAVRPMPTSSSSGASVLFTLRASGHVSVAIVDIMGRIVERSFDGELATGPHSITTAMGLAPGHYRCRIVDGQSVRTLPLIVQ
jgi:hypothetical protein